MCKVTDHFYSAVRRLTGDGPVKQRLAAAYTENLEMLAGSDVPESVRGQFQRLQKAMNSMKPLRSESPAVASVRKMSPADATRHAVSIVAMFSEMVRVKATGERVHSVSNGEAKEANPVAPAALN